MSVVSQQFTLELAPVASSDAVVRAGSARFTVLTSRLVRLEYQPTAQFEDRASQAFWFRDQPVPDFDVRQTSARLEIETADLLLRYENTDAGFTPETLSIQLKASGLVWHPGDVDAQNLHGTTRTLDFINGYAPLEPGLMSRAGWAVLDDSATLVLNDAFWLEPRAGGGTDLYFFGYGHDYKTCLRDYCAVGGPMPLIPRWALGNWWSRYWAYTQDELTSLLHDFERYEIPLSVCIVDMDWHITETGNACSGWTGYSWNRTLFPDPQGFIDFAHDKHLKVSLNLHPAEGIHDHEDQYAEMARCLGIDPDSRQPVLFDIANPAFAQAYFDVLHRPHERMGVDFWWIDWQQGQKSTLPGLDPLWFINHLHFYDLGRDGVRRPFIFSRWGREGHQRYPIGFSGDTFATWDSLRFQTYMTPTASNIAYGWWSHDIGGHTSGDEDPELYTRWVQFGVFSPINRTHATKGPFYDRRPWAFEDAEVLRVLREALQLRHAFVPYIYTMARRAHDASLPLLLPMYYDYPEAEAAYHCPRQYLFGTELIAAPFVEPADADTRLSRQVVWLPDGDWTHFFTGEHFSGGWHAIYGKLADIPLFARAGAIVPLGPGYTWDIVSAPDALDIHVFAGADNRFELYEDDGETTGYLNGQTCVTPIEQRWGESWLNLTIGAAHGETRLVPAARSYRLAIHGVQAGADVSAEIDGRAIDITTRYDAAAETLHVDAVTLNTSENLRLRLETDAATLLSRRDRQAETLLRLLKFFRLNTGVRNQLAGELDLVLADPAKLAPYIVMMSPSQARALCELLYDAGLHVVHDTHEPTLVVVWNNRQNAAVTYRYADGYGYFGSVQFLNHVAGPTPKFDHFVPPARRWQHGAQGEHVHRTQWSAQLDYANLFTAVEGERDVTP